MTTVTRPMSPSVRANHLAKLNPGYRFGYDTVKGAVAYFDPATDQWIVYAMLCLDGKWREYHNVTVDSKRIGREFVTVN